MHLAKKLSQERDRLCQDARYSALNAASQDAVLRLCLASPWLANWVQAQPDWVLMVAQFEAPAHPVDELTALAQHWSLEGEVALMLDLRLWRNRHLARLMARDIWHLSSVAQTALAVSTLADAALRCALAWCMAFWQAKDGLPAPCDYSDGPAQLVVLAMGKHGAEELNLSSDIDLIFTYSGPGTTSGGRSHEAFFTRVARKLIHVLDARTAEGFVFRVDMRLRPWGQSGALVSNYAALENYYLHQGRFWERFAMVKARPVTGPEAAQQALADLLHPFVYRPYVDYQALGALRELKSKIQQEVQRQHGDDNIKLGQGGIREVEFIAQMFQLIRGGQEVLLQQRGTWPVLQVLARLQLLPEAAVDELTAAYDYLRDLEHRIQAINDQQTQLLPTDEVNLERLALSLGAESVPSMLAELSGHRARVHSHFSDLIAEEVEVQVNQKLLPYMQAWLSGCWTEAVADPDPELTESVLSLAQIPAVQRLSAVARDNMAGFIPRLWLELARYRDAPARLVSIRPLLEAIVRRSSYFVLFAENPVAISELVKLVPASPWLARQLQEKPFLLDELTDRASLYRLPDRAELQAELHLLLLRVPEDDLERQMELLRHFRHARALRAAACEISGVLPLMKISDYLAWVAEVVVDQALALAWRQLVVRHGRPSKADGDWCDPDFGVIAYGKMGGLELSYESDLDLVFLHNASAQGVTEGPKVIDNGVFMARLGQKLIHLLSAITPSGRLYEIDTRLRPSGNSGLLVSSLAAFAKYQQDKAWTWEHQALIRARFIAGDKSLKHGFDAVRAELLAKPRDIVSLRRDVLAMRHKMRAHLSSRAQGADAQFNFKQDPGGIVDLEFLIQFLILAYAHDSPQLTRWSDNARSIEALYRCKIFDQADRKNLLAAYLTLRQEVHHAILKGESNRRKLEDLAPELVLIRSQVIDYWQRYLDPPG
jgi:glutamate-ammonia-ligase adenylyltransferase